MRFYLLSSLPHVIGAGQGICQQPQNMLPPNPALRALLVALDAWVAAGQKPPASRVPRSAKGTLLPRSRRVEGPIPAIPGVTYNGLARTGDLLDFGPSLDQGILTVLPPTAIGTPYTVLVPKTDRDGNDVAGIRLPAVAVPTATYTGWALRRCGVRGRRPVRRIRTADRLPARQGGPARGRRPATLARGALPDPRAVREALRASGEAAAPHQRLLLPEDAVR